MKKTTANVRIRDRFELMDGILLFFLILMALVIIFPVINVLALSFASQKEAAERPLMMFPLQPTIDNYYRLFQDPRIVIGYKTTLLIVLIGVPLNMLLTTSLAYGLSRTNFPGGKVIFYLILLTMLFNGGIVPMYLLMLQLGLTKSLFSVLLFYAVDRWNEWYNAMIFLRRNDLIPLQLVLRTIVMDSNIVNSLSIAGPRVPRFTEGIQSATIIVTMLPIMCFFPFLQKYFVKGIMVGAIKA